MTVHTTDIFPAQRCYAVARYTHGIAREALLGVGVAPAEAKVHAECLPDGFPFVYRVDTALPIAPILLYLKRLWDRPKAGLVGPRSLNSAVAQAYDICDFLEHLDAYGLGYETIDQEIFDKFAENLAKLPSPRSGKILTHKSVKRRVGHVADFLAAREFQKLGTSTVVRKLTPVGGRTDEPLIHPLTPTEWKTLLPFLGPLPSERLPGQSSALRLIAEWAVLSGARRFEIANLKASVLEAMCLEALDAPDRTRILTLDVTKGGVPRPLWVHPDLIRETRLYLAGERREALAAKSRRAPKTIFVHPASSRSAGAAIRPDTITTWFRKAVKASALVRRLTAGTPGQSPFVFHDLRHTFAVWTYVALQNAGVQRPWKVVQARLGHKYLETTERIYLAYVEDHEVEISNLLQEAYGEWSAYADQ